MTDEPRTPLTLEYTPESPEEETRRGSVPVIVVEPSFRYPGTVFIGVHPFGKRLGCHLMPSDAERVRNHLSKLLMDPGPPVEGDPASQGGEVDWTDRIEKAATRVREVPKPKRASIRLPKVAFRLEFALGRFQGVVGTANE